jgi:hypothetical protein
MLAIAALLLPVATNAQTFVDDVASSVPETVRKKMAAAVTKDLRDPLSAQLRNVQLSKAKFSGEPKTVYCGEINAKNAHGGYVGFKPFFYEVEKDEATILRAEDHTAELRRILFKVNGCLK